MTPLLLWLHAKLTAFLAQRKAIDPEPVYLPHPDLSAAIDDAESDAELPPAILDALRSLHAEAERRDEALPRFPETPNNERFVVWSRGTVQLVTNDAKAATKTFARAKQRTGIHRFWDREHHTSVPRGLREQIVIPQETPNT